MFSDGTHVMPNQARTVLRDLICRIGLNPIVYGMQSLRVGRTMDLIKYGYLVEEVCRIGRWRSTTVYKYIRNF